MEGTIKQNFEECRIASDVMNYCEAYVSSYRRLMHVRSIQSEKLNVAYAEDFRRQHLTDTIYQRENVAHTEVNVEAVIKHVNHEGWLDLTASTHDGKYTNLPEMVGFEQPLRIFFSHSHQAQLDPLIKPGTTIQVYFALPVFLWGELCGFAATLRTCVTVISVPTHGPLTSQQPSRSGFVNQRVHSEPRKIRIPAWARKHCVLYSAWYAYTYWSLLQALQISVFCGGKPPSARIARDTLVTHRDLTFAEMPLNLPPLHWQFLHPDICAHLLVRAGLDADWLSSSFPQVLGLVHVQSMSDQLLDKMITQTNGASVSPGDCAENVVKRTAPTLDSRYSVSITVLRDHVHRLRSTSSRLVSDIPEPDIYVCGLVSEYRWGDRSLILSLYHHEGHRGARIMSVWAVLSNHATSWVALGISEQSMSTTGAVLLHNPVIVMEHCPLALQLFGNAEHQSAPRPSPDEGHYRAHAASSAVTMIVYVREPRDFLRIPHQHHPAASALSSSSGDHSISVSASQHAKYVTQQHCPAYQSGNSFDEAGGVNQSKFSYEPIVTKHDKAKEITIREVLTTDIHRGGSDHPRRFELQGAVIGVVVVKVLLPWDGHKSETATETYSVQSSLIGSKRQREAPVGLDSSRCRAVLYLRDLQYEDEIKLYLPLLEIYTIPVGGVVRAERVRYCVSSSARKQSVYIACIDRISKIETVGMIALDSLKSLVARSYPSAAQGADRQSNDPHLQTIPVTDLGSLMHTRAFNRARWRVRCQVSSIKSLSVSLRCSSCMSAVIRSESTGAEVGWVCSRRCTTYTAPMSVWQVSLVIDDGTAHAVAFVDGEKLVRTLLSPGLKGRTADSWDRLFHFVSTTALTSGYVRYKFVSAVGLDDDDGQEIHDEEFGASRSGVVFDWERRRGSVGDDVLAEYALHEAIRRADLSSLLELTVSVRAERAVDRKPSIRDGDAAETVRTVRVQLADQCTWQVRWIEVPVVGAPALYLDVLRLEPLQPIDVRQAIRDSLAKIKN